MPHPRTSPALVDLLLREIPKHGLTPYHVRHESVGLIFNRIWAAIKREALLVVAEGVAEPEEVDGLMHDVLGGMGVFHQIDEVGLDVALDIEEHYAKVGVVSVFLLLRILTCAFAGTWCASSPAERGAIEKVCRRGEAGDQKRGRIL